MPLTEIYAGVEFPPEPEEVKQPEFKQGTD